MKRFKVGYVDHHDHNLQKPGTYFELQSRYERPPATRIEQLKMLQISLQRDAGRRRDRREGIEEENQHDGADREKESLNSGGANTEKLT